MYLSTRQRNKIKLLYGGKCAYSGTKLELNWQIDHVKPLLRNSHTGLIDYPSNNNINNLVPCQALINHYKGPAPLEIFREYLVPDISQLLRSFHRQPRTSSEQQYYNYISALAKYFGIAIDSEWNGIFYFELIAL